MHRRSNSGTPVPPSTPDTVEGGHEEAVELDHVVRRYGDAIVLNQLSLHVRRGEFVAVTGRSGSGKSTLLRLIMGLEAPDAGTVWADQHIAVSFQEPRLQPWLRVGTNVGFGLPRDVREERIREALEEVQLSERVSEWPLRLSGGQAQRVSLARAIAHRPELLLLDEPFGALDALTRADMQRLVLRLRAQHHWSVVMVTHDVGEAVRMADRVLVLRHGAVGLDLHLDRSDLDERGRPRDHERIEAQLLDALTEAPDAGRCAHTPEEGRNTQ